MRGTREANKPRDASAIGIASGHRRCRRLLAQAKMLYFAERVVRQVINKNDIARDLEAREMLADVVLERRGID
jgi:hypothetical protein